MRRGRRTSGNCRRTSFLRYAGYRRPIATGRPDGVVAGMRPLPASDCGGSRDGVLPVTGRVDGVLPAMCPVRASDSGDRWKASFLRYPGCQLLTAGDRRMASFLWPDVWKASFLQYARYLLPTPGTAGWTPSSKSTSGRRPSCDRSTPEIAARLPSCDTCADRCYRRITSEPRAAAGMRRSEALSRPHSVRRQRGPGPIIRHLRTGSACIAMTCRSRSDRPDGVPMPSRCGAVVHPGRSSDIHATNAVRAPALDPDRRWRRDAAVPPHSPSSPTTYSCGASGQTCAVDGPRVVRMLRRSAKGGQTVHG